MACVSVRFQMKQLLGGRGAVPHNITKPQVAAGVATAGVKLLKTLEGGQTEVQGNFHRA